MAQAPAPRIHLLDVLRAEGDAYFWASHEGSFPSGLDGSAQAYKPWLKSPYPEIELSRSVVTDAGDVHIQNISGNTIDREVSALLRTREFEQAYFIYRQWLIPDDIADFTMHGFLGEQQGNNEEFVFRMRQTLQPGEVPAYEGNQTRECDVRYRSAQCGMRRGDLFVPLTTANISSASSIGRSTLALEPNLHRDEVVMILIGTGAGQERYIALHTATTFTPKSNFSPAPDGTSQFIVTGPGTMKVSPQVADIFSSTTIGKTGLGRTTNQDIDGSVYILSGTGAGQWRAIASNNSTTYTISPLWTTPPDGTSRFIVVYRACTKDYDACNARGVLERFPGLIHLQPQIVQASVPQSAGAGAGPVIQRPEYQEHGYNDPRLDPVDTDYDSEYARWH